MVDRQRRVYEKNNKTADELVSEYHEISNTTLRLVRRMALLTWQMAENAVVYKEIMDGGTNDSQREIGAVAIC